ncbi:Uncharacterised protein [Salmonella enterica subsp. enterica serovar Typhi]|nr:Uncharacterised protein [Salmonella enterica subsp. enterica serovar Typhi]
MLFRQITFVFGRKVDAPEHRVFKCLTTAFQNGDRIGVIHLSKVGGDKTLQTSDSVFIHAFGKELHVIRTLFQNRLEDIFQHGFRQTGVVFQIGERHFRLQHPELRQVAAGVGIFRAEGRPKSIDFGQRTGIGFTIELAGDGQE